jgi:hypothetical protein
MSLNISGTEMIIKSLYECCICALAHNPQYINLTVVPKEIYEDFIKAAYAALQPSFNVIVTRPYNLIRVVKQFPMLTIGVQHLRSTSYISEANRLQSMGINITDSSVKYHILVASAPHYYQFMFNSSNNSVASYGTKMFEDDVINKLLANIVYDGSDDVGDYVILSIKNIPAEMVEYGCKERLFTIERAYSP